MKARLLALLSAAVLAVSASGFAQPASAGTLTFELVLEYSGGDQPASGTQPWLTATFEDTDTNEVTLTLDSTNLVDTEFVGVWLFNYNFDQALTVGSALCTTCVIDSILITDNLFNGDGAHDFDIQIDFAQEDGGSGDRFGVGDQAVIVFTGTGLDVTDFDVLSAALTGGHGPFLTSAHVQGISGDGSGWITTPIPGAVWLFGSALLGLIGVGRGRARARRAA